MDFDANMGLPRRYAPGSDDARWPTLARERDNAFAAMQQAGASALRQHALALAGGSGSTAARFDPLNYGSVFSRQYPGLFDSLRDQQRAAPQPSTQGVPTTVRAAPVSAPPPAPPVWTPPTLEALSPPSGAGPTPLSRLPRKSLIGWDFGSLVR